MLSYWYELAINGYASVNAIKGKRARRRRSPAPQKTHLAGGGQAMTQARRPSPLQRRVLIVLAALDAKRPGPVATRDIERVLEQGRDAPVYGPNLRASCRRMETAGWLRTLRAQTCSW